MLSVGRLNVKQWDARATVALAIAFLLAVSKTHGQFKVKQVERPSKNFLSWNFGVDLAINEKTNDWLRRQGISPIDPLLKSAGISLGGRYKSRGLITLDGTYSWSSNSTQRYSNINFAISYGRYYQKDRLVIVPAIGIGSCAINISFRDVTPSYFSQSNNANPFLLNRSLFLNPRVKIVKWQKIFFYGFRDGFKGNEFIAVEMGIKTYVFASDWFLQPNHQRFKEIPEPYIFNPFITLSYGWW